MPPASSHLHCTLCAWFNTVTVARWAGIAPNGMTHYLCDPHRVTYGARYRTVWIMTNREVSRRLAGKSPHGRD